LFWREVVSTAMLLSWSFPVMTMDIDVEALSYGPCNQSIKNLKELPSERN